MAALTDGRGLHRGLRYGYTTHGVKIKPTNREILCQDTGQSISMERLASYKLSNEQDSFNAVSRHLWNTALCESLYPTLQCFEIVLRNVIDSSLSMYYRPSWFDSDTLLRPYEKDSVEKAKNDILNQGKIVTSGRVIAELPLGFWTGLFVHEYDKSLAIPIMKRGLRGFPNPLRTRRILFDRFDRIRYLRNRVAHHEPIWHWQDLPKRHEEIVAFIGYMNPTQQKLNALLDRFPTVYSSGNGWKQIRARIGSELLPETSIP